MGRDGHNVSERIVNCRKSYLHTNQTPCEQAFVFLHQPDAENSPHLPIDDTFIQIKQKKEGFYWKSYKKLTLWKEFRVFAWSFKRLFVSL